MGHPFPCSRKAGWEQKPRLFAEVWAEVENPFALQGVSRSKWCFKSIKSYSVTSVDLVEELRPSKLGFRGKWSCSFKSCSVKCEWFAARSFHFEENQVWLLNAFGAGDSWLFKTQDQPQEICTERNLVLLKPGVVEHSLELVIVEVQNLPLCPGCSQAVLFGKDLFITHNSPLFFLFLSF